MPNRYYTCPVCGDAHCDYTGYDICTKDDIVFKDEETIGGDKKMVLVTVGRLGDTKTVEMGEGSTVGDALSNQGFTKLDNEMIRDADHNILQLSDRIKSGGLYLLVRNVKAGLKPVFF